MDSGNIAVAPLLGMVKLLKEREIYTIYKQETIRARIRRIYGLCASSMRVSCFNEDKVELVVNFKRCRPC